jgi:streptogramin lyase
MRRVFAITALVLTSTASGGSRPVPVETHVVPTGQAPCGVVAARDGDIWVGVYGAGRVLRIDPRRGKVTTTVRVGHSPCRVVVGPAAIWVTRDRAGEIVRISRGSGRLVRLKVGAGAFDVVLARGSVWATSFEVGTVAQFDAATTKLRRVYRDGPNPAGITSCRGRIWVGHGRDATWLTSIDPRTNRMRRVETGFVNPGWPRCISGDLWVTTSDSILRVDALRGRILGTLRLGGTPAEAAAGPDGLVWVTDKERSLVHRVDPTRVALVDSFPAGPGAYSLARARGAMWITSFAGSDVRRYTP